MSLTITVVLCLLFSICTSIPIPQLLYPTFILQVVNRAFLYGGNAAFISLAFPPVHFGKIYGLLMAISAVVSLLQYPCFVFVKRLLGGNPLYLTLILTGAILTAFVHPINVLRECRQREEANIQAPPPTPTIPITPTTPTPPTTPAEELDDAKELRDADAKELRDADAKEIRDADDK